ncbi:MAG: hypothetical protein IT434_05795 [Phycisphaerales bacterium]|nr:hypothetical protein [Phycisphaerales bacterium]
MIGEGRTRPSPPGRRNTEEALRRRESRSGFHRTDRGERGERQELEGLDEREGKQKKKKKKKELGGNRGEKRNAEKSGSAEWDWGASETQG